MATGTPITEVVYVKGSLAPGFRYIVWGFGLGSGVFHKRNTKEKEAHIP